MHTNNVSYFFIIHGLIKRKTKNPAPWCLLVYAYSLTLLNAVFSGQKLCLNRHGFKPPFVCLTRLFVCLVFL